MALSVVQSTSGNAAFPELSVSKAFSSSVTAGNLIVVCVASPGSPISSITDSLSNSYTSCNLSSYAGIYYAKNITGGSCTVTATASNYSNFIITIYEIGGADTTEPLDKSAENEGFEYTLTHPTGTTATTTQNNEICIAMHVGNSNYTNYSQSGGYTSLIQTNIADEDLSMVTCHKIISFTGAQSNTFSSANTPETYMLGYGAIATFREASGSPPSGTNQFINVGDVLKPVSEMYINVGDVLKPVSEMYINVGDVLKQLF